MIACSRAARTPWLICRWVSFAPPAPGPGAGALTNQTTNAQKDTRSVLAGRTPWAPRPFSGCCRALQPLLPGHRPCVPRDEREPDPGGPCPCGTAGLPRAPPRGGLLPHLPAPLGADRLHGHRIHGFLPGRWAVRALRRAGHLAGHPHDEPGPARWTTARTDLPRPRAPGPRAADHEADL